MFTEFQEDIQLLNGDITAKQKSLYEVSHLSFLTSSSSTAGAIVHQFSEAPRSMRDKMSQLKGEIGEKTSWDSKYCSELFHRR